MTTWTDVQNVFAERRCPADCPYLREWEEDHPPYLGDTSECLVECDLSDYPHSKPEDCPVLKEASHYTQDELDAADRRADERHAKLRIE